MGFTDLANQADASREEIKSYLEIIDRNTNQVLKIIDDILDLAKVEAGKVDIENIQFSLPKFLGDLNSLLGFRAKENGIGFNILAKTDLPSFISTDPTRLRQIIYNAVGNAIKFTQRGSVTLHVSFNNELLEFIIADTGRGISEEQSKNLFQAFVQADSSTTRKFGGTGLGLVLTKRLCQLLGGDYTLEKSALAVGSEFKATMKVSVPENVEMFATNEISFRNSEEPIRKESKEQLEQIKALVVEDSADNRALIRMILERQGVSLDFAFDGLAGVEKALSKDYDIVIMDTQMPLMDGHEAVKTLRSKGYNRPIIALTAHAMKSEEEKAKQSGFNDFLSKPIQREGLIKAVSELANKHIS